jgi:hypothetical protein
LDQAIKKYGKENFKIEVLCWARSKEELDTFEIQYIKEYSLNENLYNITGGGTGGDTTSLHPEKDIIVQKRSIGIKKWHDSLTTEQKSLRNRNIQFSKKGKSNGHEGLKHSPEIIEKIRQSNILFDRANNAKWKKAHADAMAKRAGNPLIKKYKPVIVNDVEYPSIKHAMEALGIKHRATFYNRINKGTIKVIYK